MAESLIKEYTDRIDAGAVPAESLNHYQNALVGAGAQLEIIAKDTFQLTSDVLGNTGTSVKSFIAPFPLEILEIYAVVNGSTGTAIVATLVNLQAPSTAKNPLTAANIDIDALTADYVAEAQTISATQANVEMAKGDNLRCTWTTDGSSTLAGSTLMFVVRPIQAVSF